MDMKKFQINTQSKFMISGLLACFALISAIAFFAINDIQNKMDRTYSEFAQTLTRTYALEYEKISSFNTDEQSISLAKYSAQILDE